MSSQDFRLVNCIAELERNGWPYSFTGDETEVRVCCPSCDEKNPSCSINVEKNLWKCQSAGCGASGDIISFLALVLKSTRVVVMEDLSKRYDFTTVKIISSELVEKYHTEIWNALPLLKELRKRGINDESVRKYRLGFNNARIIIPVYNESKQIVNLRRYLPGAVGSQKMKNMRGHGRIRLYPVEQLEYDTIVLCGGEIKAIAVAQRLNSKKIGAVSTTGGEGNWHEVFTPLFRDKKVFVCFDVDEAGETAADSIAARVRGEASWVGKMKLPLDVDQYPTGDVNDYFGLEEKSADDFVTLMDATTEWVPPKIFDDEDDVADSQELAISDCTLAKYSGRRIAMQAIIVALDTTPYIIPKRVQCDCDKNQPFCSICPVYALIPEKKSDRFVELELNPESPAVLEMVNTGKSAQRDALREGLHIPVCKSVSFKTLEHFNVEDLRLAPQLDITTQSSETKMLPAYSISHGLEMNVTYRFEGRPYPHPRSQQAVLLLSKAKPTEDALSKYSPTDEEMEELMVFRPKEWTLESLEEKIDDLYSDIEANVTRIFKRRELHLAIDLAFHSVLLLKFDSQIVKGWVETLVVGDSSQGKTETSKQLMNFYKLGVKVECKNASVAGLLGGVQQLGSRWFVTWGIIPMHDRRLVVLEELKGASTEIISHLTDMRSEGIAEIPKIEKRRTHARTRLVALSNPRYDMPVAAYNYGVEVIRELIGSPEDIRRFDYALIVASSQVKPEELNKLARHRPNVEHKHSADACRRCILWAWTRTPEQVEFTDDATTIVLTEATRLCEKYTDVIPLVDRGSMRLKLARLAASIAVRTFSSDDFKTLIVRECHVQFIVKLIDETYSDPVFGYADFSEAYLSTRRLRDVKPLRRKILATPFPADFVEQLLHTNKIELRDICDWCGWERGEATDMLSFLVRKHALKRSDRAYRKNPEFIELLKEISSSGDLEAIKKPKYVEGQEEF